jgi:hypothetical protein
MEHKAVPASMDFTFEWRRQTKNDNKQTHTVMGNEEERENTGKELPIKCHLHLLFSLSPLTTCASSSMILTAI